MAKPGRPRKLTVARVKEALEKSGAIRSAAAHMLGCHRTTLHRFMSSRRSLEAFARSVEEDVKDLAETKLLQAIRAGDGASIRFYLETKAKDRGYSRRVENVGKNGKELPIPHVIFQLPDNGRGDARLPEMTREVLSRPHA